MRNGLHLGSLSYYLKADEDTHCYNKHIFVILIRQKFLRLCMFCTLKREEHCRCHFTERTRTEIETDFLYNLSLFKSTLLRLDEHLTENVEE